jgi:hypothetical protein
VDDGGACKPWGRALSTKTSGDGGGLGDGRRGWGLDVRGVANNILISSLLSLGLVGPKRRANSFGARSLTKNSTARSRKL